MISIGTMKVSLHINNFCHNSTIIRIIPTLEENNSQIIVHIFFFFFDNFTTNVFFKTEHVTKDMHQILMKKAILLLLVA